MRLKHKFIACYDIVFDCTTKFISKLTLLKKKRQLYHSYSWKIMIAKLHIWIFLCSYVHTYHYRKGNTFYGLTSFDCKPPNLSKNLHHYRKEATLSFMFMKIMKPKLHICIVICSMYISITILKGTTFMVRTSILRPTRTFCKKKELQLYYI